MRSRRFVLIVAIIGLVVAVLGLFVGIASADFNRLYTFKNNLPGALDYYLVEHDDGFGYPAGSALMQPTGRITVPFGASYEIAVVGFNAEIDDNYLIHYYDGPDLIKTIDTTQLGGVCKPQGSAYYCLRSERAPAGRDWTKISVEAIATSHIDGLYINAINPGSGGGGGGTPPPVPTNTPGPSPTPGPTDTPGPSPTPTSGPTDTPGPSPTPTATTVPQPVVDYWVIDECGDPESYLTFAINNPDEFHIVGSEWPRCGDTGHGMEITPIGQNLENAVAISFRVQSSVPYGEDSFNYRYENNGNMQIPADTTYLIYNSEETGFEELEPLFDVTYKFLPPSFLGPIRFNGSSFTYRPPPIDVDFHVSDIILYTEPDPPPLPTCDVAVYWPFTSGLAEWENPNYQHNLVVGYQNVGSMEYVSVGGNRTSVGQTELDPLIPGWSEGEPFVDFIAFSGFVRPGPNTYSGAKFIINYEDGSVYEETAVFSGYPAFDPVTVIGPGGLLESIQVETFGDAVVYDDLQFNSTIYCEGDDITPTPTPGPTDTPGPSPTPGPSATPPPTPTPPPPPPPDPPGQGVSCYQCYLPDEDAELGEWLLQAIEYVFCWLYNMFVCRLRIWILEVGNWVRGVWNDLLLYIVWLYQSAQSFVNWVASNIANLTSWVVQIWDAARFGFTDYLRQIIVNLLNSPLVQTVWATITWVSLVWDQILTLIRTFLTITASLYEAGATLVSLFITVGESVITAWTAPAYEIDFIPGASPASLSSLEAAGPNSDKILWLVLVGIGTIDTEFGAFPVIQALQYLVIGLLSLGVIAWTFRQFYDILPI